MIPVRIAGPEDAEEVGRVLADGFAGDPVMTWVFDAPNQGHKLGALFGFLATEALVPLGATYVVPGSCAAWTPPHPPAWPEERTARYNDLLLRTCTGAEFERLANLDAAIDEHHPEGELWYLSAVATVTGAQGRGLGSTLLRASLRRVDAAGLPAYLESTNPRNLSLYGRHGFRSTGTIELPDGPALTTMVREARPTAGAQR